MQRRNRWRTEMSLVEQTRAALRALYVRDNRPWVVAFSGGKDSTLLAQLVGEMMLEMGSAARKQVYLISTDTRVEAPNIEEYLARTMVQIGTYADHSGMPLQAELVRPEPPESFWGQLIGKGYPSPTRWFRWCTSKMKIRPMRRRIDEITARSGSVILLLGTRRAESPERAKRMMGRELTDAGLNPHDEIPNALVATPIVAWNTDAVWEYLLTNPPPWGGDHRFLYNLYRQAEGGECPVILDLGQPSCGGSRFGCWTCTVVKLDKSMEGFIDSGEEWMRPLNEFRNWLKVVREERDWRQDKLRNGIKVEGQKGPFKPGKRLAILEKLLHLENICKKSLINDEELGYIQQVWSREFDLSGRSALDLALRFGRHPICWEGSMSLDVQDDLLEELVAGSDLDPELVRGLLRLAHDRYPNLDGYGMKTGFEREIRATIERAITNMENA
ncbi:MAG: DNA phosphorothioation system sulfurtransferase DndC [Magnetococcales bacterium]|nr:DNA phosphorothioation system sulfurtransferase DndC [Magnetococcales bacterium]